LYKRNYVHIPFELQEYAGKKKGRGRTHIAGKYDAVLCSGSHTLNSSIISIKGCCKLGSEFLREAALRSAEDKYAAYINSHSHYALFVDVPEGVRAKASLLFVASETPLNMHVVVNVGKGAQLSLMETYESRPGRTVMGISHETHLRDGAHAEIGALHKEGTGAVVVCFFNGRLGPGSRLKFNAAYSGGSYVRVRNTVEASSHGSCAEVNEIVIGTGSQKFDVRTRTVNAAQLTNASLQSRAALMDTSRCVLKGFAKVESGASGSFSHISERGILLDAGTRMDSLPDMSVDESNVKATHSSATAPIGSEELFYLMSRGVGERQARKLIVDGFFAACIKEIGDARMRDAATSLIKEKTGM
jgi:Fe-S cluster assembly protein SufD